MPHRLPQDLGIHAEVLVNDHVANARILSQGTSGWRRSTSSGIWRLASPSTITFRTTASTVLSSAWNAFEVIPRA